MTVVATLPWITGGREIRAQSFARLVRVTDRDVGPVDLLQRRNSQIDSDWLLVPACPEQRDDQHKGQDNTPTDPQRCGADVADCPIGLVPVLMPRDEPRDGEVREQR